MNTSVLSVGDPVPWFSASTLADTRHDLGILGGRWISLFFGNDLNDASVMRTLADVITSLGRFFNDDHVVFYSVLTSPPVFGTEQFVQASHRGMGFMKDYDGAITRLYGAQNNSQLIIIDPLMRVDRIFALGEGKTTSQEICNYLSKLPPADLFSGTQLIPPILILPRVFEPEFCAKLIGLHEKNGGKDTGFMRDEHGKTKVLVDHSYKSRTDYILDENKEVCEEIRSRIARRVVPMMERFFRYRPTRMERYMVSCYDVETGGHFSRHRDDLNKGAAHRRLAASFNLNNDFDGGELLLPEFNRKTYRASCGGGIAFSTALLHEVVRVTRGKRYAFLPFFYGEEEVAVRLRNNELMHAGEKLYVDDGSDRLFP